MKTSFVVVRQRLFVWQVLNRAVRGHSRESLGQARQHLASMIQDSDFEFLRDMSTLLRKASSDSLSSQSTQTTVLSDQPQDKSSNAEPVELAARTVCPHLCNSLWIWFKIPKWPNVSWGVTVIVGLMVLHLSVSIDILCTRKPSTCSTFALEQINTFTFTLGIVLYKRKLSTHLKLSLLS